MMINVIPAKHGVKKAVSTCTTPFNITTHTSSIVAFRLANNNALTSYFTALDCYQVGTESVTWVESGVPTET